jgi:HrpA-like RNA helicase
MNKQDRACVSKLREEMEREGEGKFSDSQIDAIAALSVASNSSIPVDLIAKLVHMIVDTKPAGHGAILIFLPGLAEILKTCRELERAGYVFCVGWLECANLMILCVNFWYGLVLCSFVFLSESE